MTPGDRERYSRQILFPGIGEEGQERLLEARVAIVGCGALGSFQAGSLARAGVGFLTVIDRDYVETSNLQRQWLFEEEDAAQALPKAAAAERRIASINSGVRVRGVIADLTPANIEDLLGDSVLILDGTDNFETRYLVNDYSVAAGKPWVHGAALGSYGLAMPVVPGRAACYACLYPEPPAGPQPTCETAGVLNAITSAVASLQVAAALRILVEGHDAAPLRLTTLDVWDLAIRNFAVPPPDPQCRACGKRRFTYLEGRERPPISLCGRNAVQIHQRARPLDLQELKARLAPLGEVRANDFALRFFPQPYEITVFADGRAIIKGTTDVGLARSLYARYLGS
ncbi:MAG: ThiF family adenylyltransferase [Bryobacterales bacterium]|nr:ThiF family adenylyltransferase [Bryobacterales bacterium]